MADSSVEVRTGVDGSVVIQPHGVMDYDGAVRFRQVLVHTVRKVRPLRLILDLGDVSDIDAIHVGTIAALCDLADDHHVAVFLDHSSAVLSNRLRAAGVAQHRLRSRTPAAAG
jgi:anti-anti-sigma regulatory factor